MIIKHKHRRSFYMKWKEWEREQDTGERVCERGRVAARRGSDGCKNDR